VVTNLSLVDAARLVVNVLARAPHSLLRKPGLAQAFEYDRGSPVADERGILTLVNILFTL
jgi:hypothetical protein